MATLVSRRIRVVCQMALIDGPFATLRTRTGAVHQDLTETGHLLQGVLAAAREDEPVAVCGELDGDSAAYAGARVQLDVSTGSTLANNNVVLEEAKAGRVSRVSTVPPTAP